MKQKITQYVPILFVSFIALLLSPRFVNAQCTAIVSTLAGSGTPGFANGTGAAASFYNPAGVTLDGAGNVYVADQYTHVIRKITPGGVVSTLAGSGSIGSNDGTGAAASFNYPAGVTLDGAGNVYVADLSNHKIRKITPAGVVSTLAGSGTSGAANGTGATASFNEPNGVAVDGSGNVYVADRSNHTIRKITPGGVVSTLAGSGTSGAANGTGAAASFNNPYGVSVDGSGNVYVADRNNHKIRKITSGGVVSTLAGSGSIGSNDGTGAAASFNYPAGVTLDGAGNVYVADYSNSKIRKITSGGVVSTLAGNGFQGAANGTAAAASFNFPSGVAVDGAGNVYVADESNHKIRKIACCPPGVASTISATSCGAYFAPSNTKTFTSSGTYIDTLKNSAGCDSVYLTINLIINPVAVSTLAGSGTSGAANGTGAAASFSSPNGVAVDGSGNVYVADRGNHTIRKITPGGVVSTLAGSGSAGAANGTGAAASFYNPAGVAVDGSGNVYVADQLNYKIRKITPAGVVSTLAGSGSQGTVNGTGAAASFSNPTGIALDGAGNVYVADYLNNKIRKITPAGVVSTLAGSGSFGAANGTGAAASFNGPVGVAVDGSGNVYVADRDNHKIRKITPGGVVSTLAGSGTQGAVNGTGAAASFNYPIGVSVDGAGNVYVADYGNHKIRKINQAGVVSTLAGSGTQGAVNGTGAAANFNSPTGVALDGAGNVYVGDYLNHTIRKISCCPSGVASAISATACGSYSSPSGKYAWTASGTYMDTVQGINGCDSAYLTINLTVNPVTVSSFAGSGSQGSANGTGVAASFYGPDGVAVDGVGNLYVADQFNHKIRKITPGGVVSTLAGSGSIGSVNGTGAAASFTAPSGVSVDGAGNVYVADLGNHKIRKITPAGVVSTLAGSGSSGAANGTGAAASFSSPNGVAVDGSGNVYVADRGNHTIRKITPGGVVSTLAGSGSAGAANGTGAAASFDHPTDISVDGSGNVYVADNYNHKIRKITPGGVVSTLAGSGSSGAANGTGAAASFNGPNGVVVDGAGNVYVGDQGNHKIRKITSGGVVSTIAGNGTQGATNGIGAVANFNSPTGVAIDGAGNVYVADYLNQRIRKISCCPSGVASTISATACGSYSSPSGKYVWTTNGTYMDTVQGINGCDSAYLTINLTVNPVAVSTFAGSGSQGSANGTGVAASFNLPTGVTVDGAGNVYVADRDNHKIRKITPAGVVSTLAGSGSQGAVNGTGAAASFSIPTGVALDGAGNVYVADQGNHTIRKITPGGVVSTLAGSGSIGSTNGTGAAASFSFPTGVALDGAGNVYVADQTNHKIRKITPGGVVSTLAGSGSQGAANGTGAAASFYHPSGVTVDGAGNVYVADQGNHTIRKITPGGVVSTLAGSGSIGSINGTGAAASFSFPTGVALDGAGNVYVADRFNHKIRKITPGGVVSTLAGNGSSGAANGTGAAASFNYPNGVTVAGAGNVYVADQNNHKIRKISCCQTTMATLNPVVCGAGPYTSPGNKTFTSSGMYMDTIQNAGGCDSVLTINLTISNPSVSVTPTVASNCIGGVVNIVASGAATYVWSPGGSTNDTLASTATSNTTYTVTASDANGCTITATATVNSSFPTGNLAQTNGTGTMSLAGTKCDTFLHPNTTSQYFDFHDANCNKIASLLETPGGVGLGSVKACVTVEATTPVYNGQPYVARWYEITPENNGIPANVILYFTDSDIIQYNANNGSFPDLPTNAGSATTIPNLAITKTNGIFGSSTPTVIPVTATWSALESSWSVSFAVSSFSQFRLHQANPGNAALPIVLKDFTVEKAGSTDLIKWTTSSEYNNKYFEVERSSNGIDFRNLGRINTQATNGLSNTELSYQYIDHAPEVGHNYYRLKQVDFDGNYTYTEVVDIVWGAAGSTVSIYPNPVSDVLNVDLSTNKILNAEIRLLDMSGRVIKSVLAKTSNGLNHVTIALNDIAAGVYGVQIYENNKLTHVQKIRKNH